MSKNKKIDLFAFIVFGVLVLSIVMAIVGICIAWTSTTVSSVIGNTDPTTATLGDWAEANSNALKLTDKGIDGFAAMQAFAYITVALTAVTTVMFVVSKFLNLKFFRLIVLLVSLLLVASAIITIALTFSFCSKYGADVGVASTTTSPAIGAWLLTVFSVIGGVAGIVGALKK